MGRGAGRMEVVVVVVVMVVVVDPPNKHLLKQT